MDQRLESREDGPALKRLVTHVLLPLLVVVVGALGLAYLMDVPVTDLLRDPSATLDGPWYVGLFSTTGIALWAVAAAVCMLTMSSLELADGARALLLAGAVISIVLGVDDGFLVHETIKNGIGIPSPVTIGIYGIVAIVLLRPAWSYLRQRRDVVVFYAAIALFAVSVILDGAGEAGLPTPPFSSIVEDVAKFLGIATWATFFTWVCRDLIRSR